MGIISVSINVQGVKESYTPKEFDKLANAVIEKYFELKGYSELRLKIRNLRDLKNQEVKSELVKKYNLDTMSNEERSQLEQYFNRGEARGRRNREKTGDKT